MSRISRRMTMGHDSCANRKLNPDGIRKITRKEVLAYAQNHGLTVSYHSGTWWLMWPDGQWRTAGKTNYLILEYLEGRYGLTPDWLKRKNERP